MHLPDIDNDHLSAISNELRQLTDTLLADLAPDGSPVTLDGTADLLGTQPAGRLFRLTAGQLHASWQGKWVYSVEVGELLGITSALHVSDFRLESEGPIELLPYRTDDLLRHVNSYEALQTGWTRYLVLQTAYFQHSLALLRPARPTPATGFLDFEAGEVIIHQGDEADCVYTLLEGSAEVLRDGVKVGDIKAEEIFGAMAPFTGQPRSATVVATSECSVLAVRKEDFLDLVVHQPRLCLDLVQEMADKINQLNQQILELQQA